MTDNIASGGIPTPGSAFAGLRVGREIGRGGAGVVFLAHDDALDRDVALKILHRVALDEDPGAADRFQNEAQIAARLEHPAIIPVYATGIVEGTAYISMRYVPGRSLSDVISQDGPLAPAEAIELLRPIAAALDYAAEKSIVHRDVKPGNILVDESVTPPRALLGDFGIARAYESTRHTATGAWVGTPEYMAPEILKDTPATASADQYSLACVLVEAISGISPFKRSSTAATITAQVTDKPNLAEIPQIGPDLRRVLITALAKEPKDRYASCTALLDAAIACEPSSAARSSPHTITRGTTTASKPRRRRMTVVSIALLVAVAAAAVAGWRAIAPADGGSDSQPTSSTSAGAPARSGDVLILGTKLKTYSAPWTYLPGQNAATALRSALALQASTTDLDVRIVPGDDEATCSEAVRTAIARPPSTAVVVFGSACQSMIARQVLAHAAALPPTFYNADLVAGEFDYMALTPRSLYRRWKHVGDELTSRYGTSNGARVALTYPISSYSGAFEAGVFSRHLHLRHCASLAEPGATESLVTSEPMTIGALQAGRGSQDQVDAISVDLAHPMGKQIATINSEIHDRQVDCVSVPALLGIDKWIENGMEQALRANPDLRVLVPFYDDKYIPAMPDALSRRVFLVQVATYIPPTIIEAFRDAIDEAFGARATQSGTAAASIYMTAKMIGALHARPESDEMPTLPPGAWDVASSGTTLGGSAYSVQDQDVAFNKELNTYSWYPVFVTQLAAKKANRKVWVYYGGRNDPLDLPATING